MSTAETNKEYVGMKLDRIFVKRYSHSGIHRQSVFECVCDCGNILYKDVNSLRRQKTFCCRDCRYTLVGKTFNFLKVDSISNVKTHNLRHYNCTCICGTKITAKGRELNNGTKRSCGCKNRVDLPYLVDYENEYIIVLRKTNKKTKKNTYVYECLCKKCNNTFNRYATAIKTKKGCNLCYPNDYGINQTFGHYRERALKKKLCFDLDKEEFVKLCEMNCHYCDAPPKEKTYKEYKFYANGIDRVNNEIGYNKENCVPCCNMCNWMKGRYTQKEFLDQVDKINNITHNKENNSIKGD